MRLLKKSIIFVLLICAVACFTGCGSNEKENDSDRFVRLETHMNYAVFYDKYTKVMYTRATYSPIVPLYNADGSLLLYDETERSHYEGASYE